ncbi:hypothetical protein HYX00_05470 [Candidatus Woesearchaeota archaeon]|nr:hypothetical protein [Candidatus Woesearchaeota archaeon]
MKILKLMIIFFMVNSYFVIAQIQLETKVTKNNLPTTDVPTFSAGDRFGLNYNVRNTGSIINALVNVSIAYPNSNIFNDITNHIVCQLNTQYAQSCCDYNERNEPIPRAECQIKNDVTIPPNPIPSLPYEDELFSYVFNGREPEGIYQIKTALKNRNNEDITTPSVVRFRKVATTTNFRPINIGKVGYILLVRDLSEATPIIMQSLTRSKNNFPNLFYEAANRLATIDASDPVKIIEINDDMVVNMATGETTDFRYNLILKKFYRQFPDIYDYLLIYAAFPVISLPPRYQIPAYYQPVINNIEGIGLPLFDYSRRYGSNGKLKGYGFMNTLSGLNNLPRDKVTGLPEDISTIDVGYVSGPYLHEILHQWCCYVGDEFRRGVNNAKLEIRGGDNNAHFYPGLQSLFPSFNGHFGNVWISNGDGTFRIDESRQEPKFHPFSLYFMGILPESEYNTKYSIYDAGLDGLNRERATYYKSVSVNDIIAVAGRRRVADNVPTYT